MNSRIKKGSSIALLTLGALGIVYGDIGTSPLYAINELFFGHNVVHHTQNDVIGAISLIIWALILAVAVKYIVFVLRADNEGEGGVFALLGLIENLSFRSKAMMSALLIIAAGLLFGDGIITPAISVLSAVEGLKIATPSLANYIVPLTIVILTVLFAIQSGGTGKIGKLFGPILLCWFISIGVFGLVNVLRHPYILLALNPYYAASFLTRLSVHDIMIIMGAVILVITGGEAMYADLGHFGKTPIRISWFLVVFPALVLNYLGQGAYMLYPQPILAGNIFYSMLPSWSLIPMVILATMATIIASQALISGAFSLASQGISLGLLPYTDIVHTNQHHRGQIYVPLINWALYVGCIVLVLTFKTSNHLASAYGLAVAGVMLITSLAMIHVMTHLWKWNRALVLALFIPFVCMDAAFLFSNSLKIAEGGYIPLSIGLVLLTIMKIWEWGRSKVKETFNSYATITVQELVDLKKKQKTFIPRSYIVMSPDFAQHPTDRITALKQLLIDRYSILPQHILFVHVDIEKVPHVPESKRFTIVKFYTDEQKGTIAAVRVAFGFMEEPNVEAVLNKLASEAQLDIDVDEHEWLINVMHERLIQGESSNVFSHIRSKVYALLASATISADVQFGLGEKQPLTAEFVPVVLE